MMTSQQRAARTRKQNDVYRKLYKEITKPAHEKVECLLNGFLRSHAVRLKWIGNWRLKNGEVNARLLKIQSGGLGFIVLIDGYKNPKSYSSSFWKLL